MSTRRRLELAKRVRRREQRKRTLWQGRAIAFARRHFEVRRRLDGEQMALMPYIRMLFREHSFPSLREPLAMVVRDLRRQMRAD